MRYRVPLLTFALVAGSGAVYGVLRERALRGTPTPPPPQASGLQLDTVARGLESPVYLTQPAGDDRLFVIEQAGRIRTIRNGALEPQPWLDITGRVGSGGERGLLSLAFHPRFRDNGRFFVDYTDRHGDTHVAEFHADPSGAADSSSEKQLLFVRQPFANHNGGLVLFGPDGRLYVGMGDGGSAGDPHNNGQDRGSQLGKLLRIDVDAGTVETWAIGLRNPWRFAFDSALIYIADVGQNSWEEIDVQPAVARGLNYGWRVMEGSHCFINPACSNAGDLVMPTLEYDHGNGCSVIGGVVYRGRAVPALVGHYLYSDYCTGWLRSFKYSGGAATEQRQWDVGHIGTVLSFGEDASREAYILSGNGMVLKIR